MEAKTYGLRNRHSGLAGIEVAGVEARAFEREIAAFGSDLAARDLRAQRIDQPAGANDQGIAVKAVLTVQPKRELAAEVHPQRHMMAIPRRRVVLHQPVHGLLAKEKFSRCRMNNFGESCRN